MHSSFSVNWGPTILIDKPLDNESSHNLSLRVIRWLEHRILLRNWIQTRCTMRASRTSNPINDRLVCVCIALRSVLVAASIIDLVTRTRLPRFVSISVSISILEFHMPQTLLKSNPSRNLMDAGSRSLKRLVRQLARPSKVCRRVLSIGSFRNILLLLSARRFLRILLLSNNFIRR